MLQRSSYRGGYDYQQQAQMPAKEEILQKLWEFMQSLRMTEQQPMVPDNFGGSISGSPRSSDTESYPGFTNDQLMEMLNEISLEQQRTLEHEENVRRYSHQMSQLDELALLQRDQTPVFNREKKIRQEFDNQRYQNRGSTTKRYQETVYNKPPTFYAPEVVHQMVNDKVRKMTYRREYSNKVFIGGIPPSMNRKEIERFFASFGDVCFDWPNNSVFNHGRHNTFSYLFLVYLDEQSVHRLLASCKQNDNREHFVTISHKSQNTPAIQKVQVRPWMMKNCEYIADDIPHDLKCVDTQNTVFVGGLPRIVTAEEIATIFTKYGKVLLVNIDVDQDYGYPKGAARVCFKRNISAQRALDEKFLKLHDIDSNKTTVEIKPYLLEDVPCDECGGLWYNPAAEITEALTKCQNEICEADPSLHWKIVRRDDTYSNYLDDFEENNVVSARKIVDLANFFDVGKSKIDYFLWDFYAPSPTLPLKHESSNLNQALDRIFRKECRTTVVHNKSNFCAHKSCRQHYCPSCFHTHHSNQTKGSHSTQATSRNDNRPRKDKPMYLVPSY